MSHQFRQFDGWGKSEIGRIHSIEEKVRVIAPTAQVYDRPSVVSDFGSHTCLTVLADADATLAVYPLSPSFAKTNVVPKQ
ncbi:hypothetical protein CKA32_000577 [Geitlerinema sp. FC II]|nr:hypothetical protein CKA32_000577 [Geitlerinema sp. FC II]